MPTLLLVDDDSQLVDLLAAALARYTIVTAADGEAALHQLAMEKPDLVLLDLRLPIMDGAVLLSRIRAVSQVPMIVLSARAEQSDVVQALQAGADDFLEKPFDLDELEARVEAVLRRSKRPVAASDVYTVGSLSISRTRFTTLAGGEFYLTPTEHKILLLLAATPNQLVTFAELYERVWGGTDGMTIPTLTNHVMRLRSRLRGHPGAPTVFTVRGRGFMLRGG